jgi:hypothetical protein
VLTSPVAGAIPPKKRKGPHRAFLSHNTINQDASSLSLQLCEMSGENTGIKRARTQQQDDTGDLDTKPGRDQLLLTSPELQTRFGRKFVDESELLPLLLSHGLVRRVRTIEVHVRHLGGDSFNITLEASTPSVGEAKAEITRSQGTAAGRQELYRVAERADGLAVREDDEEPEPLDDETMMLNDRDVVAMAVKELPLLWRTFPADRVTLSEGGALVIQTLNEAASLTTTEIELTEGKHYWEVELSKSLGGIFIGISRPSLDPTGLYLSSTCTDGWFINAIDGTLFGNGKAGHDEAGGYTCGYEQGEYHDDHLGAHKQGDRVGMLLDLDNGSLRFFKNGVQHGPGFPAGSVTGPVVHALHMYYHDESVRLLPNAEAPAVV